MATLLRILFVEDNENDALLTLREVRRSGFQPEYLQVRSLESLEQALRESCWDIVLCDYHLPRFNALDVIRRIRQRESDVPIIVLSGAVGEEAAALAMREGANDFLVKDRLTRLGPAMRRELEQARVRVQLAQADRLASVGLLAAGVAHEINNPLTYMLCHLSTLVEDQQEIHDLIEGCQLRAKDDKACAAAVDKLRKAMDLAQEAHDGAERVQRIVRDLHTFARADDAAAGPLQVNEVLSGVVNLANNLIRSRARLVQEYGQVPPVFGNPGKLAQVFLNLIANATQAITEGEAEANEIRLQTRLEGSAREGGRVIIEVHDTGRGIAPGDLGRLFDPFFTTKEVGEGSGLGLSICHNIVSSMGGEIQVESCQGEGTCFRICLPGHKAQAAAAPPAPSPPEAPATPRGRIMIIDDEPAILRTVKRMLSKEHEVVTHATGQEALDHLERDSRFDVILCDLMMPGITGMDLHEVLTQRAPDLVQRLIFLTGGAFTQQAKDFFSRISNTKLEKPFDLKELRSLVRQRVSEVQGAEAEPDRPQ